MAGSAQCPAPWQGLAEYWVSEGGQGVVVVVVVLGRFVVTVVLVVVAVVVDAGLAL